MTAFNVARFRVKPGREAEFVAARPRMIALLDTFRDTLEDLGGGLGVTDPVSGEVVVEM